MFLAPLRPCLHFLAGLLRSCLLFFFLLVLHQFLVRKCKEGNFYIFFKHFNFKISEISSLKILKFQNISILIFKLSKKYFQLKSKIAFLCLYHSIYIQYCLCSIESTESLNWASLWWCCFCYRMNSWRKKRENKKTSWIGRNNQFSIQIFSLSTTNFPMFEFIMQKEERK